MPPSTLGLLVGLALGFAAIFGGFGDMLIVGVVGALGFTVGKAIDGELDLAALADAVRRR